MHEIGIETVGLGALKLTGFLKELMQRRNISFESLYTVRTIKEVNFVYYANIVCLEPLIRATYSTYEHHTGRADS
jgi:actin-related protein 8